MRLVRSTMAEVSPEASALANRSFINADTVPHAVELVSFSSANIASRPSTAPPSGALSAGSGDADGATEWSSRPSHRRQKILDLNWVPAKISAFDHRPGSTCPSPSERRGAPVQISLAS